MNAVKDAPNTMLVKTEALTRALKLLMAAGCQFAVIDAAGVKHGTLEVMQPTGRKPRNHPPGTYLDYHRAITSAMLPGESKTVAFGQFDSEEDRESLRSSITAFCSREWGAGTYITAVADTGIEVLRVE